MFVSSKGHATQIHSEEEFPVQPPFKELHILQNFVNLLQPNYTQARIMRKQQVGVHYQKFLANVAAPQFIVALHDWADKHLTLPLSHLDVPNTGS